MNPSSSPVHKISEREQAQARIDELRAIADQRLLMDAEIDELFDLATNGMTGLRFTQAPTASTLGDPRRVPAESGPATAHVKSSEATPTPRTEATPSPEEQKMRYFLIQQGDGGSDVLHSFATPQERDAATMKLIFGEEISTQDEAEQWDKYRQRFIEDGEVTFEGDPGLSWFTAIPDSPTSHQPAPLDWPKGWNMDVVKRAYSFVPDDNGQLLGLTAGDHGFEETGIIVDMTGWQPIPDVPAPISSAPDGAGTTETDDLSKNLSENGAPATVWAEQMRTKARKLEQQRDALKRERDALEANNLAEWSTLMADVHDYFKDERADRGHGRVRLVLTLLGQLRYERDDAKATLAKTQEELSGTTKMLITADDALVAAGIDLQNPDGTYCVAEGVAALSASLAQARRDLDEAKEQALTFKKGFEASNEVISAASQEVEGLKLSLRDELAKSATEADLERLIPQTTGACSELFHSLGMGPKPEYQDSCRYMVRHDVSTKLRYWARYQHADKMIAARLADKGTEGKS